MRYFLLLACSVTALALGIDEPASAGGTVLPGRPAQRGNARLMGAIRRAVHIPPVAVTAAACSSVQWTVRIPMA